jgi:uncharacterized membrane protein YtjA (UPF0391 family)
VAAPSGNHPLFLTLTLLLVESDMLRYTLLFLLIAILAGVFGFTNVAGSSYLIAKILFFVFLVLFVLSLLFGRRVPSEI